MKTMRNWLIDKAYHYLISGLGTSDLKFRGRLKQGVTITLYNIPSTIALLTLAALLQILPYVLVFMAAYGLIRSFAYGIHLKNCYLCAAWGFLNFIGGSHLATKIHMSLGVKITVYWLCLILFTLYAPANNEYQPFSPKRKSLLKMQTLVVTSILLIISVYFDYIGRAVYSNVIMFAMIAQTINVLPVTYMLFGENRNFEYVLAETTNAKNSLETLGEKSRKAACKFQIYGAQFMLAVVVLSQLRTGQPFWHNAPYMDEDYYNTLETITWRNFGKDVLRGFRHKK